MSRSSPSYLLTELSWVDVRDHLARDGRLIVPVGACDQYGPHLPLGSATRVTEAVARELARDFGVLCAPTLPYGVNIPGDTTLTGAAGLREKTLHRVLNDLLGCWESHGVSEFILMTAQAHDPHVEALATVSAGRARVRVIELLAIDFSRFLAGKPGPQHGGEVLTSLMLYLDPDKVNLARAVDSAPAERTDGAPARTLSRLPPGSSGAAGEPTLATAETGRQIYQHIVQRIRTKVFLAPPEDEE